MARDNLTTIENPEPLDYSDPDVLVKDAWKDAANIKDPFMRLQVKLKLAALMVYAAYGVDVDTDIETEEVDE